MLRVFFGLFGMADPSNWWEVFGYDNALSQFQWGKTAVLDGHTIMPVKRNKVQYIYPPVIYDEYVDLQHSVVNPTSAEFFAQFVNQGGITTPYPVVSTSVTKAVHNALEVDGDLSEWLYPTKMLSSVYPPVTDPVALPEFWAINETLENNPLLPVTGYASLAACVKSGTSYGIAEDPCVIGYNAVTDTIRLMWRVPFTGTITKITVYRAPVYVSEVPQKYLNWPQWGNWRLGHNHLPIAEITPSAAGEWQTSSAAYLNTATYPYPTPTKTNWCVFKPFNNAIARMNLAWQRRVAGTSYMPLVIDTDAMLYWKGYLVKASPVFEVGIGKSDDKAAAFTLAITEHGSCTIDALTDPNTSGNFTAVTRTL